MAIKAVFFDAAGTLIKPARGVGESYVAVAATHGICVSPAEITERFHVCFEAAPRLAFPGATDRVIHALERDWWKRVVAEIFQPWSPMPRFDEFFDELFAYFARPGSWTLYPEVIDTLATLRQRGLVLGVISNFDSRLVSILNGLGIGSSFRDIFVSSRVGYAKPEREIFHAALKRYRLRPDESLHVGDSEINDRKGANDAGLRGLLVDRRKTADAADPTRLTSLASIVELVA
ncbi:MAG: HAD-IA family hydrolase [Chloroflexota bacterium]